MTNLLLLRFYLCWQMCNIIVCHGSWTNRILENKSIS